MPRVETTGRLGEVNVAGPFIWDCLAQVSFQGSSSYLVQLPWTERNSFKLPEPRGGSHSPSAHWEINVMFRQPQYLAITLVVSHSPQYSHIPYHKKTQIPYLNTVIKLPTSNDSWDRAPSHLLKRLIQREQISAPKIILKIHPGCSYLGWHPLKLNYIPLGHPKSAFLGLYLPHTYKEIPCSPRLSSVQPK